MLVKHSNLIDISRNSEPVRQSLFHGNNTLIKKAKINANNLITSETQFIGK